MQRGRGQVCWLGRMEYTSALKLQEEVAGALATGRTVDTLLLMEHPATYTLGRRGKQENLLVSQESLVSQGAAVYRVDRGGDVTFHGPGQLVGYPILDLKNRRRDVVRYLRQLEEALISALDSFGVTARRIPGYTGVWVGEEKIAAIGVKVDAKGITRHGFALNVTTDLQYFSRIVPCGIRDKPVTSVAHVLGRAPELVRVAQSVAGFFGEVFCMDVIQVDAAALRASLHGLL